MTHSADLRLVDETAVPMLDALFEQSPIGLHLLDTELRVVRINPTTPGAKGMPVDELLGRPAREVYDMIEDEDVEALLTHVLETGEPLREYVLRARLDGDPRHFEATVLRLRGPRGRVLGLAVAVTDVTERERARTRSGVLDAVRAGVGRTLDPTLTGEEFVTAVVPAFADAAIVEVVDAVIRGDDPPLAPLPPDTPLMRTAYRSGSATAPRAHQVGDVHSVPGPTPFTQALTDLRPRVVPLDPAAPWLSADPARAQAITASRAHSLLVVPLTLRDTAIGLISLYRAGPAPAFDAGDQELAAELAAHTALCVDNARRYTREHTVAATVQRQLLPRSPETHTSLEAAYLSVTGVDPGAWYDTIALSSARTALVVGTVAGRALNATAAMGQLRTAVRSLSAFDLPPDELLARLHDTAGQLAAERADLPLGDPLRREALTADCVYAVHDPLTGTCTLATAGRLAPVLVHPDGTVTVPATPAGPRLGTPRDAPFAATEVEVPEGSVLIFTSTPLLTSYLSATSTPLPTSPDRPLQDLCDALVYALPPDLGIGDAAVIVARTRPFPSERCVSWQLAPDPTSVATARHRTAAQLTAWHIDDDTSHETQLIVSELVTNAIRYGSPPLELRLIHDRTLTCEVRDNGDAAPHLHHAGTAEEGGRGLFITSQLAAAWGTRYSSPGKTIWTELTLPDR
ncbi:SpoIIE family protein phosphatase [Streptomyces broussonetiae]|uniref:SpoIIE family protein phosphatase n=1 Tax=Streptomyces broussonetiae TaxID=2686304 RepID=A0ABV5ELF9_9ACTN